MNLRDEAKWKEYEKVNDGPYGGCCVKIARMVMQKIDALPPDVPINAEGLVFEADRESNEGITGFMAGCVATMISRCHARGEEFRRSWNKEIAIGTEGEEANCKEGAVLNPALLVMSKGGGN